MTDLMKEKAYELPNNCSAMTINFDNVDCVFEVKFGFLICFASGLRVFVSNEQRQNIVKAMENHNAK